MKVLITVMLLLISGVLYSQNDTYRPIYPWVSVHFGLGNNRFTLEEDDYNKLAADLGVFFYLNKRFIVGLDLSIAGRQPTPPRKSYSSQFPHIKYDASCMCLESYLGLRVLNRTALFTGVGVNFAREYHVVEGSYGETYYEINKQKLIAPVIGVIYDILLRRTYNLYLKYNSSFIGYNKNTLSIGLKM